MSAIRTRIYDESERGAAVRRRLEEQHKNQHSEQMLSHLAFDAARSDYSYRSSVANHQPPATGQRSTATDHLSSAGVRKRHNNNCSLVDVCGHSWWVVVMIMILLFMAHTAIHTNRHACIIGIANGLMLSYDSCDLIIIVIVIVITVIIICSNNESTTK